MAELDEVLNKTSETDQRITQLSGKLREEAEAREAALAAQRKAEEKAEAAERLASFSEGFADIVSEIPDAKQYKDQLKEKVLGGMSLEDAKVWAKGMAGAPTELSSSPAGGSAATSPPNAEQKEVSKMSQQERRQKLLEAEQRGDITWQ